MAIYHHAATHVGHVREHNEDRHLADGALSLYAVADGLGGHAAGEVAAEIAVATLARCAKEATGICTPKDFFNRAFIQADEAIHAHANDRYECHGMGTTLTALRVVGQKPRLWALFGHAGDSRCYLLRNGQGRQITTDHSSGRHRLSNCLGASRGSLDRVDVHVEPVFLGDILVLCTDGLNYGLPDAEAVAMAHKSRHRQSSGATFSTQAFADRLIDSALAAGGPDNVTVVVVAIT